MVVTDYLGFWGETFVFWVTNFEYILSRFQIEGHVTGFGHPDWVRTHEAASGTCPVVSTLVEGGATCVGKTVVDELAYGYVFMLKMRKTMDLVFLTPPPF